MEHICDSKILAETNREKEFLKKIFEWTNYNKMELIYRGSRDGMTSNNFHNKCDYKNPTIVLYKNIKNSVFGGFTSLAWANNGDYRSDPQAFIFTLINIHNSVSKILMRIIRLLLILRIKKKKDIILLL